MTTEFKMVPVEPTAEMLAELAAEVYPDDNNAGKALQRLRGCDVVFPKYEVEAAVGKYQRMLSAAPASPQASQPVAWTCQHDLDNVASGNIGSIFPNAVLSKIPLYTQADAGEVERWKTSAEDATQVQIRLTAEVKALRAQLAEALSEIQRLRMPEFFTTAKPETDHEPR